MKQEIKERWVQALRSGEYEQGRGTLRRRRITVDTYCCLGVLCDVAVKDGLPLNVSDPAVGPVFFDGVSTYLPRKVEDWAGLRPEDPVETTLARMNDNDGASFDEIAAWIEENL